MPVARAVPAVVVTTMAAEAFDLPVAPAARVLPAPVLAITVSVPVPVAPVATAGRSVAPAPAVGPFSELFG